MIERDTGEALPAPPPPAPVIPPKPSTIPTLMLVVTLLGGGAGLIWYLSGCTTLAGTVDESQRCGLDCPDNYDCYEPMGECVQRCWSSSTCHDENHTCQQGICVEQCRWQDPTCSDEGDVCRAVPAPFNGAVGLVCAPPSDDTDTGSADESG